MKNYTAPNLFALLLSLFFALLFPSCTNFNDFQDELGTRVYTVTFDSQGATVQANPVSMTVTSPKTTLSSLPVAPTRTGYQFGGWWTEPEGEGSSFIVSSAVYSNITAYASWTPITYSITWHLNEGTLAKPNPISYSIESDTITFNEPNRDAFYFTGWYDNEDCTGNPVTQITNESTGNRDFWAGWSLVPVYTVTFDSGTATTPLIHSTMTVTDPATTLATLPANPERIGYDFGGWYSEPNGAGTTFNTASTVSANSTVYAKWTPISYSITWNLNEGTLATPNPTNYTIESPAISFGEPTRDAYYFAGWYDNAACTGDTVSLLATGSKGAREYWAGWRLINIYTVTFDSGTATTPMIHTTMTVTDPATNLATLPANPERIGYDFQGWYSEPDGAGTAFNTTTTVSISSTVYAKWTPITFSITWHLNEGTLANPNPTCYTIESDIITFNEPNRNAFYFEGWYDNEYCEGNPVAQISTESTGDREYWAFWTLINTYTVTFISEDAATPPNPSEIYVTYPDKTINILPEEPTCSRLGYTFGGWYFERNGEGQVFTSDSIISESITVYANWVLQIYTIELITDPHLDIWPINYTIETEDFDLPIPHVNAGYELIYGDWRDKDGNTVTTIEKGTTGNFSLYYTGVAVLAGI